MRRSTALLVLDDAIAEYHSGASTNVNLLSACFAFLTDTDDWEEIVEVMKEDLKMGKEEGVEWFNLMGWNHMTGQIERQWDDINGTGA